MTPDVDLLHFPFRGRLVPVTYHSPAVTREQAELALRSGIFSTWYQRCEKEDASNKRRIEIHGVEIQSVDLFGSR
jgi:hypothetical protein